MDDVLELFGAATRAWFADSFASPTAAQEGAWKAISAEHSALVVAPTGSGKTLAAFLWALDRLASADPPADPTHRCRILYVSPLKALTVDVERNLRAPLAGIGHAASRLGLPQPDISVSIRSGDTPADQRRRFIRRPSDILITTPESLFLLLTSQSRESLRHIQTVIVDEVHAVAGTKRGAHMALSLERLDALLAQPAQRIGLSATVRPVDEVARFLGGSRPVDVVMPPSQKDWDLRVVVPVPDFDVLDEASIDLAAPTGQPTPMSPAPSPAAPGTASIWPHVEHRVVELVSHHTSTIVFANSRRLAEKLTARLNEIAAEQRDVAPLPDHPPPAQVMAQAGSAHGSSAIIARAHHGSVSKEQRALIEDDLKAGRLPAVVATSSLELGIDMGAVDLVVQVEAPPSVASGVQRVGRAGHHVGAVSRGVLFPKYRGDLVQSAVVAQRMRDGQIEELAVPRNPLDVLAQQIVAMVATDDWLTDDVLALARRAYPFATLPQSSFDAVLDMLAGRYPSDEFAELRPRLIWDRTNAMLRTRPGSKRLAITSGGTIPDRGLFGVFLVGSDPRKGARVGELDEEMVYESRVGDVFALGTTSWRIEDITHDRVLVSPAPGQPGRLPFWKGDTLGRPAELGAAIGRFVREIAQLPDVEARERAAKAGLDPWAVDNLLSYVRDQQQITGHVPDDRTLVVERFRDEFGDWRLIVHSPYGARVHAPWALALRARLRERYGVDVQTAHADDGIVLRIPDTVDDADGLGASAAPDIDLVMLDPDELDDLVMAEVGSSALFAARFRECAARALLLPRRTPGRRSPLWQQRQRSAQLLQVAAKYGSFPILLETMRECLQDVYDLDGLRQIMRDVTTRKMTVVEVETSQPSPFARSLLFGYVASFIYEGDSPLAERRAQALSLDSALLAELLGQTELRELLDLDVIERTEAELQRLVPDRQAVTIEGVADLLRLLGPLSIAEIAARYAGNTDVRTQVNELVRQRRVMTVRIAGQDVWSAVEDASRLRDALGVAVPGGVHEAFATPVPDPLGDLVSRYARTHGPFHVNDLAARFGVGIAVVMSTLRRLAADGRVVEGELRPDGTGTEWCDAEVLRLLRRRSLAALRKEAEPVDTATLGRFLPAWQSVGSSLDGPAGVLRVVEQLGGASVPASSIESLVLPARIAGYSPAWLDELTTTGEVVWAGHGQLPGGDGWISLHVAETAPLTLPDLQVPPQDGIQTTVLETLRKGGAYFYRQLVDAVADSGAPTDDQTLTAALWELVWAGLITNDTLAPLRAMLSGSRPAHRPRPVRPRSRYGRAFAPGRSGPPMTAGRWSLLPSRESDVTRRSHAAAEGLLERHGVVTRGAVTSERLPGGFAAAYRIFSAFEDTGRVRRGYFVAGLGAAQFSTPSAVDRLRSFARSDPDTSQKAVVLAAADPANPYGAALPWPQREEAGHRPGRKAGALVVLVNGELVLYVERGGRTLLSWTEDPRQLQVTADALALAVREGALGSLRVERADGANVTTTPLGEALAAAGFHVTPRGLRLRA
jgi:ATP-dependent Lhr-like helicase